MPFIVTLALIAVLLAVDLWLWRYDSKRAAEEYERGFKEGYDEGNLDAPIPFRATPTPAKKHTGQMYPHGTPDVPEYRWLPPE